MHQLLVYADDVNIMDKNVYAIRKKQRKLSILLCLATRMQDNIIVTDC